MTISGGGINGEKRSQQRSVAKLGILVEFRSESYLRSVPTEEAKLGFRNKKTTTTK
jgi:hypothetical protein